MTYAALDEYRQFSAAGETDGASPHRLVEMLYAGVLERIGRARAGIQQGDVVLKTGALSSALAIVEHLRISLDFQAGGEIARNLDALYEYIGRRLLQANLHSDTRILDEVATLVRSLKDTWDGIATRQ
jgi:flagellar secretion chaperone FliS